MELPVRHLVRSLVVATAVLTAVTCVPDTAFAQRGVSRGGGGGGGGGGSRSGGGGGGGHAMPRGGHSPSPGAPVVGRGVPRGSVSHPIHPGGGHGGYYPGYVYPPYYGGIGIGWGWGGYWGGYYGWGYWGPGWWGPGYATSMWWPGWGWWGAPAMYYPPYWGVVSDAKFLVTPRNTEVYIDGALAGIVDQYDGAFQSLTLAPGTHQITFYLEGHKRRDTNVYVAPGSTLKLRHTMEPLAADAPPDERPTPPARQYQTAVATVDPNAPPASAPRAAQPPPTQTAPRSITGEAGLLVIRVQPADAEILIDGQRWQLADSGHPLEVRVPAGRVRIEIRKPGFAPFSTEVTVQPGEVTPLNVSLPSRGAQI
jgi:hypothetical protein